MIASTLQINKIFRILGKEVMSMFTRFELERIKESGFGFSAKQNKVGNHEMASVFYSDCPSVFVNR